MRSIRLSSHAAVAALLLALTLVRFAPALAQSPDPNLLVYHQITALTEGTGSVGYLVLSADGTRAVFSDAPGTEDPATPNLIFVIGADGADLTEVDAYQTWCYCGSQVDVSADGNTVVSTESMQLRLAPVAGQARTLVAFASNELSSVRLTAAGDRVFFILGRDTQLAASSDTLERGIYVVNADGGGLRQVVGPETIAELLGVTRDTIGMLRGQTQALDVSANGSHLIFGAAVGAETAVFAVDDDGSDLRRLAGPVTYVTRVAISRDGSTVAYDVNPLDTPADNKVSAGSFPGGEARLLATQTNSGFDEPLQLSDDGSHLLVSPNSLLIDTETGDTRQLGVALPNLGGNHLALITDGWPHGTMDADATRFLYVMRTTRCADCASLAEQLATLDLGPADLGAAPTIVEPSIDPASIPLNHASAATVQAEVDTSGELVGVGLVALRDGVFDVNVGWGVMLVDDGTNGDATAGDGVYTNNNVVHVISQGREDDTGPRLLRIEAEVEGTDGMLHATAVEFGPLTVVAG